MMAADEKSYGDFTGFGARSLDSHVDAHLHRFLAAAMAHAARRPGESVVASHRQAAVAVILEARVGDVDADPSRRAFVLHPDIDPGVAGGVARAAGIDVSGNVARRNAQDMTAGDEQMG